MKVRIYKEPHGYCAYRIEGDGEFYISGSCAMTLWGCKRNLKKILDGTRPGKILVEEFDAFMKKDSEDSGVGD